MASTVVSSSDGVPSDRTPSDETPPVAVVAAPAEGSALEHTALEHWQLPLVVLVAGMFMSIMDISIINVALPVIQNEFGVAAQDSQWVVTGYSLAEGVVVPVSAWLGYRFGLTRIYNLALVGFAGGSALCGLAWTLNTLIGFRILQGVLGGILPAITMAILLRIVPRDRLGAALGMYGLGAVLAPTIGPTLGGYLVEYVDWRLIFFINVPIGVIGTIAAILVLPRFPGRAGQRFDLLGFLTIAGGLFALLLALSKGEDWGWDSYKILLLFTYSALSLALFVVIELEVDQPLLDLRVFRFGAYSHSLALIALLMVALFSVVFLVPQFLQVGQGLGALDAGLVLLPPALVMAVLMPVSGMIYDRIGPRWPTFVGLTIAAVATYLMSSITLDTSRGQLTLWLMLLYGGLGMGMMPVFSSGLAVISPAYTNVASALNNVVQRTSGAFGVAVLTAILTIQQADLLAGRIGLVPADALAPSLGANVPPLVSQYATYHETDLRAFAGAIGNLFLLMAGLFAVSALVALFLRSGVAAPAGAAPPPQQAAAPAASAEGVVENGLVKDGAVRSGLVKDGVVTASPADTSGTSGNGSLARPRDGLVGDRDDARPQHT